MKKVVLISGGSDGLGKAIALRLVSDHTVIILSQDKENLEKVAEELQCDFALCDLRDYDQVEMAVAQVISTYGKIDCLINNAGIWIEGELDTNDPERIKAVMEVNTLGTIFLTRVVLPHMKSSSSGRIINVISQAGLNGKAERSVYTASKFAITGFTKALQFDTVKYGISVTGLYPGKLNTHLFDKAGNSKDMVDSLSTDEVAKTVEFIVSLDNDTVIPEVGIKSIKN